MDEMGELLNRNDDISGWIVRNIALEWKFVEDTAQPNSTEQFGHGLLGCHNEISMNMAKLAFVRTVRVKDVAGEDMIPAMKEIAKEAAKDNLPYTHFFRLPTRLQ